MLEHLATTATCLEYFVFIYREHHSVLEAAVRGLPDSMGEGFEEQKIYWRDYQKMYSPAKTASSMLNHATRNKSTIPYLHKKLSNTTLTQHYRSYAPKSIHRNGRREEPKMVALLELSRHTFHSTHDDECHLRVMISSILIDW